MFYYLACVPLYDVPEDINIITSLKQVKELDKKFIYELNHKTL